MKLLEVPLLCQKGAVSELQSESSHNKSIKTFLLNGWMVSERHRHARFRVPRRYVCEPVKGLQT